MRFLIFVFLVVLRYARSKPIGEKLELLKALSDFEELHLS